MLRMANPNSHQSTSFLILIIFLGIFCMMVILSPNNSGSSSEWLNNQSFEQYHLIELEEEVFLFAFFVLMVIGGTVSPMSTMRQSIGSIYPCPQLPPPK
jgi:hypothetical protein